MTYKEALILDKRNFTSTFFYYFIRKIEILNLFINKNKYDSIFLLLSVYNLDLLIDCTLNSLLYNDDYMEKKYNNNGNLDFFSSFFLSFLSNLISFYLMWIINKLINHSLILELIENEIKNENQYYKILSRIFPIIKKKIIIYNIISFIINIFCCYYLTIFCIIYKYSQKSLFLNYIIGIITSLVVSIILSLIISLLRKISIYKFKKQLYYFSKYLYSNF